MVRACSPPPPPPRAEGGQHSPLPPQPLARRDWGSGRCHLASLKGCHRHCLHAAPDWFFGNHVNATTKRSFRALRNPWHLEMNRQTWCFCAEHISICECRICGRIQLRIITKNQIAPEKAAAIETAWPPKAVKRGGTKGSSMPHRWCAHPCCCRCCRLRLRG